MISTRYSDIITRKHYVSTKRPHMSRMGRAAQFSPFAALTGYDAAVSETARLTNPKLLLTEDACAKLDEHMRILMEHIAERPMISVTYFIPDEQKSGGSYETACGHVRRVDVYEQLILFADGSKVYIPDIYAMEGKIFHIAMD